MSTKITKPVQVLYHGTSFVNSGNIEDVGLVASKTNKVFLTADINVAYYYAKQRVEGTTDLPVVCVVDAEQMHKDGFVFYHEQSTAEYTVSNVPSKYILQIGVESEDDLNLITHYVNSVLEENS